MSEVIFKNEHGEYRVGDRVAFVTTGYNHSVTFGKATIRGITEGGCLQLDVDISMDASRSIQKCSVTIYV